MAFEAPEDLVDPIFSDSSVSLENKPSTPTDTTTTEPSAVPYPRQPSRRRSSLKRTPPNLEGLEPNDSFISVHSYNSSNLTIEIPQTGTGRSASPNPSPRSGGGSYRHSPRSRQMDCLDWFWIVLLFVSILGVILLYFLSPDFPSTSLIAILNFFTTRPLEGGFTLTAIYIGTVIIPIPVKTIISIAAGYFHGIVWGLMIVYWGSVIGCLVAFILGRYMCSKVIHKFWHLILARRVYEFGGKGIRAAGHLLVAEPFRTILCLRFTNVPMEFVNYLASTSDVPFKPFALATMLSRIVGGSMINVFIGHSLQTINDVVQDQDKRIVPTLIATAILWVIASLLAYVLFHKGKAWLREQEANEPVRSGVDVLLSRTHALNQLSRSVHDDEPDEADGEIDLASQSLESIRSLSPELLQEMTPASSRRPTAESEQQSEQQSEQRIVTRVV